MYSRLVAALALCGVGVFVVAGVVSSGNSDDTSVTSTEGLIAISPQRGAEALQQERVSVTLEVPWVLTSMRLFDNRSFAGGVALDAFTTTRVSAIRADEIISTMVDTVLLRRLRQRERKLTVSEPDADPQEETTEEPRQ